MVLWEALQVGIDVVKSSNYIDEVAPDTKESLRGTFAFVRTPSLTSSSAFLTSSTRRATLSCFVFCHSPSDCGYTAPLSVCSPCPRTAPAPFRVGGHVRAHVRAQVRGGPPALAPAHTFVVPLLATRAMCARMCARMCGGGPPHLRPHILLSQTGGI